jgi:formate-dependent nitrite reductase membrane component NrfD
MLDWTKPVETLAAMFNGTMSAEEFWLAAVNLVLGLVVLFFVVMLAVTVIKDALARRRQSSLAERAASYQALDTDLGLVMADGGEPLEKE